MTQANDSRPNVLLISVDHWSGQLMRPMGHPVVMTPTLEGLARNGTLFTNAYSACPVCVPARRTLMTGLSGRTHGVTRNDGTAWDPSVPSLPQCFRDAGYQAYAVGKLHVNPARCRIGFDDVILNEEGRPIDRSHGHWGDDWEQYLADHAQELARLKSRMIENLSEPDRAWVKDGQWVGLPEPELHRDTRDLGNQRGLRFV